LPGDAKHLPADGEKHAAVAAVLRDGPAGAEVLLIRRAEHALDPWSGHMAFPGGRFDPEDVDLLTTALRETQEEVGLDLKTNASLLGPLERVPAIARGKRVGMTIAPFVFALERPGDLMPNEEVVEAIWAPLGALARGENSTSVSFDFDGEKLTLPGWDVDGRIVWGLTYRMLQALLEKLHGQTNRG
jgi:8-oxo-dGTP pyrophosphatase MutT (NUDIX family)